MPHDLLTIMISTYNKYINKLSVPNGIFFNLLLYILFLVILYAIFYIALIQEVIPYV